MPGSARASPGPRGAFGNSHALRYGVGCTLDVQKLTARLKSSTIARRRRAGCRGEYCGALRRRPSEAIRAAGFRDAVLVGTLAGVPLDVSFGDSAAERYEVAPADGLSPPAVRMGQELQSE